MIKEHIPEVILNHSTFSGKIVYLALLFSGIYLSVKLINHLLTASLTARELGEGVESGRILTITELVKKGVRLAGFFIGFLLLLDLIGISPQTILATAGIGSLALGMGAKTVIEDVITGFLIIVEDQYAIGDLVTIGEYEGFVEDVGVRVTKLRAFDGRLFIIPNGEVKVVTNNQRGSMRERIDIPISRSEDPDRVFQVMEEVISKFRDDPGIVRGPELWGITAHDHQSYTITVVAYSPAGEQYEMGRRLRKAMTEGMLKSKIKNPTGHISIGRDEDVNGLS